ncbi:MAG: creatininase family protein [Bdellovibrionota bacterium]
MPLELLKLSAQELSRLPKDATVFFFPVGGVEDHGPHLPIGADIFEGFKLCELAALRLEKEMPGWSGVIFPPLPLGTSAKTTAEPILIRNYILRDYLVDSCRSLAKQGFRHFVCFSGTVTPKQLTAIEDAGKIINGSFWRKILTLINRSAGRVTLVSARSGVLSSAEIRASLWFSDAVENGGKRDTSIALATTPELVADEFSKLPEVVRTSSRLSRYFDRYSARVSGYWGNPSAASAKEGQTLLSQIISDVFPKLRAVWEGSNPNMIFRSWFSVMPWNKSFFRAWLLSAFLVILIGLWSYWWVELSLSN